MWSGLVDSWRSVTRAPLFGRPIRGDRGADLIEYVVLAALFALVLGIAMSGLDETVSNNFTATTDDLTVPVSTPQ